MIDKPLYQPWNEEEFSGDVMVGAMTPIQRWMYRTLLQKSFFHSTRPYLPNDDGKLWLLAGCESKKQWMDNRDVILSMFTIVENADGSFIANKRVLKDWDRLMEKREAMSEQRRAAAESRWGADGMRADAGRMQTVSKDMRGDAKRSEEKLREEKSREENQEPAAAIRTSKSGSIEDEIASRAMSAFGHVEEKRYFRKGLKELRAKFDVDAVLNAFDTWIGSNPQFTGRSPVSAFLRSASAILNDANTSGAGFSVDDQFMLQEIMDDVASLSNNDVVFTTNQRPLLMSMIREYTHDEIIQAFKDFYSRVESDYDRKWAAKDFIEKGPQFLRTLRKQALDKQDQEQQIQRQKQAMQDEVSTELSSAEKEITLEQELAAGEDENFGKE